MLPLSKLKIGQLGVVSRFTDEGVSTKLMEMGCLPGEVVKVINIAPLGDPIAISVAGYELSLRLEEAASVMVIENPPLEYIHLN
jgi:ferrous iron transport protein A